MISRLKGLLIDKDPPHVLVDVQGVGYEVEAPMSTFYQLPKVGQEVILHTHLIVREDAHVLCGFASERERQLFRSLIKVNGVGPKLALGILSGMSIDDFVHCVQQNDAVALTRIPGVGKKTAERLLIDMRDKLVDWQSESVLPSTGKQMTGNSGPAHEALSALLALGYKPQEASRLLQQVATEGKTSETIIKAALRLAISR